MVTEFIGITFGMSIFGVKPLIAVIIGIAFISTVMLTLRYHKWENVSIITIMVVLVSMSSLYGLSLVFQSGQECILRL